MSYFSPMKDSDNRKLYTYSSLFIALALNVPKFFGLRKASEGGPYWHFNATELLVQSLLNFLFCLLLFMYSTHRFPALFSRWQFKKQAIYIINNLLLLLFFVVIGLAIQRTFFEAGFLPGGGIMLRMVFSFILVFIELRIVTMSEASKNKEIENEHLRNAYLQSELEVLKGQLNPHFFFNALGSLSAIVRENPPLAQQYIGHLSKVFRHSLQKPGNNLVTLQEETEAVIAYAALMHMRYEEGLQVTIRIDKSDYHLLLPHMSLQPLLENALKHNMVSVARPLRIEISREGNCIRVWNNLQPVAFPEAGTGIGLANLNDRYKILMHKEIDIVQTKNDFVVKLPV